MTASQQPARCNCNTMNTLQHTPTHCNTLQHTPAHCISLQQTLSTTLSSTERPGGEESGALLGSHAMTATYGSSCVTSPSVARRMPG